MTIIAKGFGSTSSNIIGHGFGPDPVVVAETVEEITRYGRSSRKFEPLFRDLNVDRYKITAKIKSINSIILKDHISETVAGSIDRNEKFSMKQADKIRIVKTKPKESIFIKVIKIFKRE
jgi:hypothetical protein